MMILVSDRRKGIYMSVEGLREERFKVTKFSVFGLVPFFSYFCLFPHLSFNYILQSPLTTLSLT